ncbi:hypothetical protein JHK85_040266 [Glycine max]|nr:hypothetical protein JHK86_039688 [Glycine max]KAG4965291.1 hypothetical protein JHK85_040266 [Glycine max]
MPNSDEQKNPETKEEHLQLPRGLSGQKTHLQLLLLVDKAYAKNHNDTKLLVEVMRLLKKNDLPVQPGTADIVFRSQRSKECPICWQSLALKDPLGNPETSNAEDWMGLVDYAWSHAVISDEHLNTLRHCLIMCMGGPLSLMMTAHGGQRLGLLGENKRLDFKDIATFHIGESEKETTSFGIIINQGSYLVKKGSIQYGKRCVR